MNSLGQCHRHGAGLLAVLGLACLSANAISATLPVIGSTFDGIPVATQYDEFYGYSTDLMTQLQDAGYMPASYGQFDFATGTGGLDVLLYTGSSGQDNQGVGPGGAFDFEDPVYDPGGAGTTEFEGWWGQNDHDNNPLTAIDHSGPVTVGQVLDYLHAFNPDNNTPFFYADINQTGDSPSMYVSINAYIADPTDLMPIDTVNAAWAMDAVADGVYDETSPVFADSFSVTGASGTTYDVNISKGSGKADFVFFAPTMDLSQYSRDALFVLNGRISGLNNGFEEFFLTGGLSVGEVVPVPTVLWLMGAGLLGMAGWRRRA